MHPNNQHRVGFDVLVTAPNPHNDLSLETLEDFRPDPQDIEMCRKWFIEHGIETYSTDFGLVCYADVSHFEALFKIKLLPIDKKHGIQQYQIDGEIRIPDEIKQLIRRITLTIPPDLV